MARRVLNALMMSTIVNKIPSDKKCLEESRIRGISGARSTDRASDAHEESRLDHIFFSHNRVAGEIGGEVRGPGNSDHHLYRGFVQLRMKKK